MVFKKTCRKQICKTSRQRKNKDLSRSRKVASSNEKQNDFSRIANPISYEYADLTHLQLFKEKIKNKTTEGQNDDSVIFLSKVVTSMFVMDVGDQMCC